MIVAALLIVAGFSMLGLCTWMVILPPRERDGFEDYDLNENYLAAGGAAQVGQGQGAGLSGKSGALSSLPNDRE